MSKKHTPWLAILLLGCQFSFATEATVAADQPIRRALELSPLTLDCAAPALALTAPEQAALGDFYRQQDYARVWEKRGRLKQLLHELDGLADDGLNPDAYQRANLDRLRQATDERQADCADLLASHAYLQALQHLTWGHLDREAVEPLWYSPKVSAPLRLSAPPEFAVSGLDDLPAAFARARPQLPAYRALRQAWAELRRQPLPQWNSVPGGPLLRPDTSDPRVPLLRQRLAAEGYLEASTASDELYTPELVDAVKVFQQRHFLQDDGLIGRASLAELNVGPAARRDQVRVNLERMRWLAHEIEPKGVVIDVAGARVLYFRDHRLVWQARTQVGRPERPTPLLKSRISHLTLNPTWTVPPTIMREDKLPEIQRDIGFLAHNQLRVLDYEGNELNPRTVDWSAPRGILLRQDAGPHNPLGRVAIRFANPFSVYMHDTPSQHLFDKLPRVFSSGCVRVEQVMQLIEFLLADATREDRRRIEEILDSGKTKDFNLRQSVPVLMAYWTVEADEDGQLLFRPDLYRHDPRILAALDRAHP